METLRTIASDIKRDLKQNGADLEVPDAQLMYWILVVAERLRGLHIIKRRSGAFLSTFVLPVLQDAVFSHRHYVELPSSIYDFDLDAAVESLSYYMPSSCAPGFTEVTCFRTDPSRSRSRLKSAYQQATPSHPYFWREKDRLYLLGVDEQLEHIEAKVYANLPDINDVDPDAPFEFPKELLAILRPEVQKMGRFALSLPGQHLTNDGTNRPVPPQAAEGKLSSVNSEYANPETI